MPLIVKTRNSTYTLTNGTLTSDNPRYAKLEVYEVPLPIVGYRWVMKIKPGQGFKSNLVTTSVQSFEGALDAAAEVPAS